MSVYEKIVHANLEASRAGYMAGMAAERDLGESGRKLRRLIAKCEAILAEAYHPLAQHDPNMSKLRAAIEEAKR